MLGVAASFQTYIILNTVIILFQRFPSVEAIMNHFELMPLGKMPPVQMPPVQTSRRQFRRRNLFSRQTKGWKLSIPGEGSYN
jgi:hypothetical protein